MGIKEKDLQVVQQLNDGDFIRVVTANGDSRKVDKNAVGGGETIILESQMNFGESTSDHTVFDITSTQEELDEIKTKWLDGSIGRIGVKIAFAGQPESITTIRFFSYFAYEYDSTTETYIIKSRIDEITDRQQSGLEIATTTLCITNGEVAETNYKANAVIINKGCRR